MSISRDVFERGEKKDSLEEQIMDFLKENKDEAFTATEIAKSFGIVKGTYVNDDLATILITLINENPPAGVRFYFYIILNGLVMENKIIKKKIDSEDYYTI